MNTAPNISHAIARGWIKPAEPTWVPKPSTITSRERRKIFVAQGLTQRGTERKRRPGISPKIIAAAARDGVGVTAIYNRIKRTGKLFLRKKK